MNLLKGVLSTRLYKKVCREVGLSSYTTIYCFRREFITSISRNSSREQASQLATRKPEGGDQLAPYDYGTGDLDVAAIRLGEFDEQEGVTTREAAIRQKRNRIREYLSAPALVYRNGYPHEEEDAYVTKSMKECEDIRTMDEAIIDIRDYHYLSLSFAIYIAKSKASTPVSLSKSYSQPKAPWIAP